jgi:hypothetical protein
MSTDQILAQLGPCVLLAIPPGQKAPKAGFLASGEQVGT